jgi:hypothetical protein
VLESLKGRNKSEGLSIDGRIILKRILGIVFGGVGCIHMAQDRD